MEVRNNADGLKTLLGVPSTPPNQAPHGRGALSSGQGALTGDRATVSFAGAEVSQSVAGDGVRADRVAAVQAALAAGTYNVPSIAVAKKVVDAMLGGVNADGDRDCLRFASLASQDRKDW
jgi:anti-sigma28 factor (negative regulator of flagellin synthesis)